MYLRDAFLGHAHAALGLHLEAPDSHSPRMRFSTSVDERVLVVLTANHELAARTEVMWDDLRDRNFIVSEDDAGPEGLTFQSEATIGWGHLVASAW